MFEQGFANSKSEVSRMLEGVARLCKGSLAPCFDKGSLSSWWLLRDQLSYYGKLH